MHIFSIFNEEHIKDAFLLINGDVILEPKIINDLLSYPYQNVIAVNIGQYYEESMNVAQKGEFLVDISKEIKRRDALGCSIDFYKFSKSGGEIFFSKMEEFIVKKKLLNSWTEVILQELLNDGILKMKACNIKGR